MWFVRILIFIGAVVLLGAFGAVVGQDKGAVPCAVIGAIVGIVIARRVE